MLTESAVVEFFADWNLNPTERGYLAFHNRRFAYVLRVVAECVRQRGDEPLTLLDIGPHFLTALLGHCYPQATLNTLGYPNPRCYRPERVSQHLQFDLNQAQHHRDWPAFPRHDVIVMSEVIEHLYTAPELVLGFVETLLKPGGFLIVQTPNAVAWSKRMVMLRGANPFEMIRQSRENPGHFREYTVGELRNVGQQAGLETVESRLENYFNGRLSVAARVASLMRPSLRQGITMVYRRSNNADTLAA
jgi:trans-aconitate methyltransferase